MRNFSSSLLLLAMLAPPALGQTESSVITALRECSAISNDAIRVACYDALARQEGAPVQDALTVVPAPSAAPPPAPAITRPVQEVAAPAAPPVPPAATRAQSDQSVASFGQEARVESNDGENILVDKVTSIRQVETTKVQLTLESGQVWRQTVGKTFMIRKGDSVRISGTNWGNDYRLTVEGKPGFIQISRVQ